MNILQMVLHLFLEQYTSFEKYISPNKNHNMNSRHKYKITRDVYYLAFYFSFQVPCNRCTVKVTPFPTKKPAIFTCDECVSTKSWRAASASVALKTKQKLLKNQSWKCYNG